MMPEPTPSADALRVTPRQRERDGSAPPARSTLAGIDAARRAQQAEWRRRRELERRLHDGAALQISALALKIGIIRQQAPQGDDLDRAIAALQDELHTIVQELREVGGAIYPPLLGQAGLGPALREIADRIPATVRVHAGPERFGEAAEGAAYFAVAECLRDLDRRMPAVDVYLRSEKSDHGDPVLVVDVVGVKARHAEPILGRISPLGGTVERTHKGDVATLTARIPCE